MKSKCPLCGKRFNNPTSLDRHLRRVHNLSFESLNGETLGVILRIRLSLCDFIVLRKAAELSYATLSKKEHIKKNRLRRPIKL